MKWIRNSIIPAKGFKAITIWPFVFYRGEKPNDSTVRHENIHGSQQKELLLLPFFIIYFIEWVFKGYRNISFEKEAYDNQNKRGYVRKMFGMWRK